MIFDLYSSCLVVDKEEEDAVDAVGSGPSVDFFVGSSEVFLAIPEGKFAEYTCPPRIGGHGTAVSGSSVSFARLFINSAYSEAFSNLSLECSRALGLSSSSDSEFVFIVSGGISYESLSESSLFHES